MLRTLLFVVSAAANAALMVYLLLPVRPEPAPAVAASILATDLTHAPATVIASGADAPSPPIPPGYEHAAAVLEHMRAEGLSPAMCYHVLSTMISQEIQEKRRRATAAENRYVWQHGLTGGNMASARFGENARAMLKRDDILLELMGADYLEGRFPADMVNSPRFAGLPPEKVREILLIESDYSAARMASIGPQGPASTKDEEARYSGDKEAEKRAVLTADEYERYQLYASDAAALLQRGLIGTDVNDQQYEAIYRSLAAAGLATGSIGSSNVAQFANIVLAEAGADAALGFARTMDRINLPALEILESASLGSAEVFRRYSILQEYRRMPEDRSRVAADYAAVVAGLSDDQRTALDATQLGRSLAWKAKALRPKP